MTLQVQKTLAPITNLRLEAEASELIKTIFNTLDNKQPIGEVEVKSKEQPYISR